MAQTASDAEQLVRNYVETWNDRKYEQIPHLVSDSFVLYDPGAEGEMRGPDGLEGFLREIVAAFPDFHVAPIERGQNFQVYSSLRDAWLGGMLLTME